MHLRWRSGGCASTTRCSRSLVAQALQANTSVRSAQAALRQARALRDVAAAGLWPTVGSSASAQRGTAAATVTGNSFKVGLDAGWELDIFGANRERARRQRSHGPGHRREPRRRAGVDRRRGGAHLHHAAGAQAAAGDCRETTWPASWRRCRSRSGACRPGWSRRSKSSRRARDRADARRRCRRCRPAIAQAAACARRADRPAAGGACDRAGRRPARCRRRPTTGTEHSRRDAAPAARRARRRTPGDAPPRRAWRRPTRRACRRSSSAARWDWPR